MSYAEEFARTVENFHQEKAEPLGFGLPTLTIDLISALSNEPGGEVFIEIDRNVILAIQNERDAQDQLLSYMYPIAVRYDSDGDVIIHVTSGDKAQF
jgi:hypothetical protein